ncbi:MAG: 2,3-bisphosphoglycerate-independent phosphoglycerate mutase [Candidatus Yanofskybacteria bacterium GW2011_GWF1_44_227]|uniref:2,3-bisphosphoglycerate-independent phosphoglycerate mutase n=1 Tax=Candidatus Yanofskybacteria bacterium GW2011_GWE2_40_11 TaxID=1619033 RepID=A0A0G0QM06_9BACT|nr:MAG: 2,3-bisphosphoglycerate-independent phosphoglycerate mutase [Candidatus Yanofskybacteria bacterium GW2011_GWE2_40_11]KKT15865.1 MAG: 2,3-bisphosphoglycerate-independent phosphoglycerate mutase [Candidatus Yanofskybacteria bacterium GW2011_GWF2_43_596]KKT53622.1 MAG: 2,3-bisphosphoglycerate-independent phosphoglycerate mutase [Candidatus Yanofskybacteria bacterium GW2011_GWF1_44_227]OGN36251.1 MAG: phosphoglycerate mutase (2,3-diphosphoglycerate-independent) [Candidatus Yanofskybacteria b
MRPVVLCILDGWGFSKQKLGNAISTAETPNIDFIKNNYPSLLLQASGVAVGLSWGESGNSEVGHLTIGAGRIIFQYLSRINKAIENGSFFTNPELMQAIDHAKNNHSSLHLAGLLTSNSVHAYTDHILALIDLAKRNGINNVYLHLYTDGKDSGLKEAPSIYKKIDEFMKTSGVGKLASMIGRDIAMDRNENWDLTDQTYQLMVKGEAESATDPYEALNSRYEKGLTDINMPPMLFDADGTIRDGDALIFFNFREDRMKQIAQAFTQEKFDKFETIEMPNLLTICMTQYFENSNLHVAFPATQINNCLSEVISTNGLRQLHIAETEKYAHVTFFFNALRRQPFDGETDTLIKSDRVATEDSAMKANEICEAVIKDLENDINSFILVNFANADMLSHMGEFNQVVEGVETLDRLLGKLREVVLAKNGYLIIASDHGNAESLTYKGTGDSETKHNPNPIPLYLIAREYERARTPEEIIRSESSPGGFLSDIAPTVIDLLGIQKPVEMTGDSLLETLLN